MELVKLRSQVVLFKVVISFTLFDLLMDLIFHLIDGIVVIRDFEWLTIDFKGLQFLIHWTISVINLSDKLLEFLRRLKFSINVFSIKSSDT